MFDYGIKKFRAETLIKYKMLEKMIENSKQLEYFVKTPADRSLTSIVLKTQIPSSLTIRKLSKSGLVVSTGYGGFKDRHIRIGNYFTHGIEDFEILTRCLNITSQSYPLVQKTSGSLNHCNCELNRIQSLDFVAVCKIYTFYQSIKICTMHLGDPI